MSEERLYTREEVSEIVRQRVKKLNERIQELELELLIYKIDKELNEIAGEARARRTTFKRFKRK